MNQAAAASKAKAASTRTVLRLECAGNVAGESGAGKGAGAGATALTAGSLDSGFMVGGQNNS
jgi:hypothetical protein